MTVAAEIYIEDAFFEFEQNLEQKFGQNAQQQPHINLEGWESWFQIWLNHLEGELPEAASYELTLRLTDDGEVQDLNAQYRQKDQPTDVLAFAALEAEMPDLPEAIAKTLPLYLGDIVISVETAARQAQQQGHSLVTELAWLSAHGLLHLLGWDHPDDESLQKMLQRQETLLQAIGLQVQW